MKDRPSQKLLIHAAQSFGGRVSGADIVRRVFHTASEMMKDRGLTVQDACDSEQLTLRIDETKPVLRSRRCDGVETLVFVDVEERTGVKLLRTLLHDYPGAILCIINVDGATPFTKKEAVDSDRVEFWQFFELLQNPTRHELVPEHSEIAAEDVDALSAELCIKPRQWPAILATDRIVRWYRFPKGSILRIDRRGMGHESGVYYRRVE